MTEQGPEHFRKRHLLVGAVLLTAGICIALVLDYAPERRVALETGGFFLIFLAPPLFAVILGALFLIAKVVGRTRLLVLPSLLLSAALAAYSIYNTRPIDFFHRNVLNPAPASVRNLQAYSINSFRDGRAYLFVFDIDPQDLPGLLQSRNFKPAGFIAASAATQPGDSEIGRPDQALLRYFESIYTPQAGNAIFTTHRLILITNPAHTRVHIYVDKWYD